MESNKYVIVHFIRGGPELKLFGKKDWPLHITLLMNFNIDISENDLINKLLSFSQTLTPIQLMVKERMLLGPNKDIQVNILESNQEIMKLHESLKDLLDSLNATYDNPEYVGKGYRPHSTVQENDRVKEGETIKIDSFSLIDMEPNGNSDKRKFIKTFDFH